MTSRLLRSISAGAALVVLVGGVPVALVLWGRSPLDGQGSTWDQITSLATEPVSDNVVFGALTIAAWATWAMFTLHVVIELAAAFGAAVRWRIPSFGPMQLGARRLVTALTMTMSLATSFTQRAGALPELPTTAVVAESPEADRDASTTPAAVRRSQSPTPTEPSLDLLNRRGDQSEASEGTGLPDPAAVDDSSTEAIVTVVAGDTPWDLAEHHLGAGIRWREIWERNRGITQPDGRAWVEPDLIHPGWRFRLPSDAINLPTPGPSAEPETETPDEPPPEEPEEPESQAELPPEPSDTNEPPVSPPVTASTTTSPDLADETSGEAEADDRETASPPTPPEGADHRRETTTPTTTKPTTTTSTPAAGADGPDDERPGSDPVEEDDPGDPILVPLLAAGASMLATQLLREKWRRRRRQSTRRLVDKVPPDPLRVPVDTELLVRADEHSADRLDTALVHLAHSLHPRPGSDCVQPRLVQVKGDRIDILVDPPDPAAPKPWRPEASGLIWVLDADQSLDPVDDTTPLPALVTIGVQDADILIDLEAYGVVALVGDENTCQRMARAMVAELSARSEGAAAVTLVGDVFDGTETGFEGVHVSPSWPETDIGTIASSARLLDAGPWPHTWAARASGHVFDGWAPSIWFTPPSDDPSYLDALDAVANRPGAGSAIVVVGGDPGRGLRIHVDGDSRFKIPELGLSGDAQVLDSDVAGQLSELLDDADSAEEAERLVFLPDEADDDRNGEGKHRDFEVEGDDLAGQGLGDGDGRGTLYLVGAETDPLVAGQEDYGAEEAAVPPMPSEDHGYEEPEYDVLVRLCGTMRIDGGRADLGPRETAVTTYIALHGETDIDQIRDAVWAGTGVSRKRCQNVISTVRGSLGDAITWTTERRLTTGPGLVTDLELIERRLAYAKHQDLDYKAEILQGGLDLVTGNVCHYPRAGRRAWTWIELDNWIHHVEALVGTLTTQLATTYLDLDDAPAAIAAINKGIEAIGKRDDLVVLLVKAHELNEDEAAARSTIRSYERYLNTLGVDEFNEELLELLDRYATPARTKRTT